ncbi:MAG TPA: hypothetical protein ENJ52_09240 [Aliiroseovarius sp.]|nr:hypothetical protein [Aliiroseovarius sp.]
MKRLILLLLLVVARPVLAGQVALSADGSWRAELVAPDRLVIVSTADGSIGATFQARARDGSPAGFEGVYTDPKRRHFVVPLVGAPEYWLIATDPDAPPVYEGFVHSREAGMIEALPSSEGLFSRRRVLIEHELRQIEFTPDYLNMSGITADGRLRVTVNLYVNREVAWQPLG